MLISRSAKRRLEWTTTIQQVRVPAARKPAEWLTLTPIDESDTISTRTLALTRYRRNHEFMNEVFMYAAFGESL